jgi:hypothetical protein
MNTKLKIILITIVLIAGGAYFFYGRSAESDLPNGPLSIEATLVYKGTLPTESGPGIETTLTLMDRGDGQGGGFNLKEVYIFEGDAEFGATGQWETRSNVIDEDLDAEVYVLTSEEDSDFQTQYYEIIDENTIRRLSDNAERIPAELAYELELQ